LPYKAINNQKTIKYRQIGKWQMAEATAYFVTLFVIAL